MGGTAMKKELIVCGYSVDLLYKFGVIILAYPDTIFDVLTIYSSSEESKNCNDVNSVCNELGINEYKNLNINDTENTQDIWGKLIKAFSELNNYDNVYSYNIKDTNKLNQVITAALGRNFKEINVLAGGGCVDQTITCEPSAFKKLLNMMNKYIPASIMSGYVDVLNVKNTILFNRVVGERLVRYFLSCAIWQINMFDYGSPWELKTSCYEMKRHALELKVLENIQWDSLIEIGACEGVFTQKLRNKFPKKKIVALEPDKYFFETLSSQKINEVVLFNEDCEYIKQLSADAIFISNVLYYCKSIPDVIFNNNARYIIVSHDYAFHKNVLDNLFLSKRFRCIDEVNLEACLEDMEGTLCIKYGSNIKVWEREL